MSTPEPIDKIGMPIRPGDHIVYGHGRGLIQIGRVIAIKHKGVDHNKIDLWAVTVWGIEDEYSRVPHRAKAYSPRLTDHKGTLQFPERIVVLKTGQIDPAYLRLLAPVCDPNFKLDPATRVRQWN
jgi:hypothetical protein